MIQRLPKGFTLLELLMVFTIISILTLMALPYYQGYQVRAQITEGFSLVGPVRQAIHEYRITSGVVPTQNLDAFLPAPEAFETKHVESITILGSGTSISITIKYKIEALGANNTIVMFTTEEGGRVAWHCTGGTVLDKYRPYPCRGGTGG